MAILDDGFVGSSPRLQDHAQVVMRDKERFDFQRLAILGDGFVASSPQLQDDAQFVMGLRLVGSDFRGTPKLGEGLVIVCREIPLGPLRKRA